MKIDPDEYRKIIFGDFLSSLELFQGILSKHGLRELELNQFSFHDAKKFSDDLILAKEVEEVHKIVEGNRSGAISFYQFCHEIEDRKSLDKLQFPSISTGDHEPFLLLASATRNLMDTRGQEMKEDGEEFK